MPPKPKITTAMLLSAGLGTRLRPITDNLPKPLVEVNGRTMLDRALDKLVAHGVTRAVVNLHYLGDRIRKHLANRRDIQIVFSHEPVLLDTGGGVLKALPQLKGIGGSNPFFCINTDLVWTDGPGLPALARLEQAWDRATMNALMLMVPTRRAVGFGNSQGDFDMAPEPPEPPPQSGVGQLVNPGWIAESAKPERDYVWVAAQVMQPSAFSGISKQILSNRLVWERALAARRLYGVVHDGGGYHAGTPEDLATVNRLLAEAER